MRNGSMCPLSDRFVNGIYHTLLSKKEWERFSDVKSGHYFDGWTEYILCTVLSVSAMIVAIGTVVMAAFNVVPYHMNAIVLCVVSASALIIARCLSGKANKCYLKGNPTEA